MKRTFRAVPSCKQSVNATTHSRKHRISASSDFDPWDPDMIDMYDTYYRVTAYDISDPDDPEEFETIIFATPDKDEAMTEAQKFLKKYSDDSDDPTIGVKIMEVYPDPEATLDPTEVEWYVDDDVWKSWR